MSDNWLNAAAPVSIPAHFSECLHAAAAGYTELQKQAAVPNLTITTNIYCFLTYCCQAFLISLLHPTSLNFQSKINNASSTAVIIVAFIGRNQLHISNIRPCL